MPIQRKTKKELIALSKEFTAETDPVRRLELKLALVREKTLEIREAWNNHNDDNQKWAMDELEEFFLNDKKRLRFHTDIAKESYKGDWSS